MHNRVSLPWQESSWRFLFSIYKFKYDFVHLDCQLQSEVQKLCLFVSSQVQGVNLVRAIKVGGSMTPTGNWSRLMVCCSRYKMLAQQYKAMYPTLETDVEGELLKLKVTHSKSAQPLGRKKEVLVLTSKRFAFYIRTTQRRSSPWWGTACTTCTRPSTARPRRSW